jgi:indole-3-glycerol phosphate synthase
MVTLRDIMERTRADIDGAKSRSPLDTLRAAVAEAAPCRDLIAALRPRSESDTRVIAEVKRRSPSAEWIRPEYQSAEFRPESIARQYHAAGAAAISCLTDEPHFSGHLSFVARIKAAVPIPVLRKDFLVDPWQVWESRAAGADAVLLIAECLHGQELADLAGLADSLGLATLIEIHEEANFDRALSVVGMLGGRSLLGVNNRDLSSMAVDVGHSVRMAERMSDRSLLVSESGIRSPADLDRLRQSGVRRVLVGENLMRQSDPGSALAELLQPSPARGAAECMP